MRTCASGPDYNPRSARRTPTVNPASLAGRYATSYRAGENMFEWKLAKDMQVADVSRIFEIGDTPPLVMSSRHWTVT